jgi:hypothetical protein
VGRQMVGEDWSLDEPRVVEMSWKQGEEEKRGGERVTFFSSIFCKFSESVKLLLYNFI